MKKDFVRDYATEAFRTYAAMGNPTYEDAKKAIYQNALDERNFKNPEIASLAAEKAVTEFTPLLLDILAVEKTLEMLESGGKTNIASAVRDVYFTRPAMPLRRGDVSSRVRRFCLLNFVSERNVYSWLKEARLLFAAVRGLRTPPCEKNKSLQ